MALFLESKQIWVQFLETITPLPPATKRKKKKDNGLVSNLSSLICELQANERLSIKEGNS